MRYLSVLIILIIATPLITTAQAAGQLGVPISWIKVPGTVDQFYMAQQTGDGQLILTPNESFFPKRGLAATGKSLVPDVDGLNKGNSYAKIERWDAGDIAEWGIFLEQSGQVEIKVLMSNTDDRGKFTLLLDEKEHSFTTKQVGDGSTQVTTATFQIMKPGRHSVRLLCNQATGKVGLHQIEITGSAANKASVLRKRWRPAAAHTRFSSSKAASDIRLWVMEMDAVPGELSFYSPITTPFGYYGPSWQADGKVNTSFNFSLWSFKRGGQKPPVEQLSHLLAVGNPQASFSGFAHEGTGVKIRNWEPLAGRQGQRQTLALRVEPGPMYDTYYSYFYAADEKQWKLFGVGNKFNNQKPLKSLWVGSFVEVPGPAPVQRTGPYERVMRYRGWVMDTAGNWSPLDRMTSGNINRKTGLTHTERGVTIDGWFYLQTGGWTFRKMESAKDVALAPKFTKPQVEYLGKEDIAFLTSMPAEITISKVERIENQITGSYTIQGTAKDTEVTLYWGTTEGLTLADRWQNELSFSSTGKFNIKNVPADKTIFLRMLLINSEGKFWTTKTVKVAP